jgi:hypothetical protein
MAATYEFKLRWKLADVHLFDSNHGRPFFCPKPADAMHAKTHAATAAPKRNLFDEKIGSLFPSMRKLLDMPSVAQSSDGSAV